MLTDPQIRTLATRLFDAERLAAPIVKVTDDFPDMDWADAYRVQDELRRLQVTAGSRVVGLKMGFTSRAKMKQMGVEDPIRGYLLDRHAIADGGVVSCAGLIHPKIEPEIAFVLKTPLSGPGVHIGDVLAATDFVVPALEVLDSRYENFRFDLTSVIADNTSACGFVSGAVSAHPANLNLPTLGVVLERNGEVVELGAGAAVLGNPALAVAALANMLGARGEEVPAGQLILTGGITTAVRVEPGDNITCSFQRLGTVSCRFVA